MARHSKAVAARHLGISRTTLYRLIEQGKVSPTHDGLIDDTELVRAAPYVDTIKARIETSSDTVHERDETSIITDHGHIDTRSYTTHDKYPTSSISAPVDTVIQGYRHTITPVDSVHERHDPYVTARHWTDENVRYQTHLEGEVDMLRTQVHTLQAQIERLHEELREVRIARDHAEEEARTERGRYVQMLQEFYQRYDRLLDTPRALPAPLVADGSRDHVSSPAADRGDMRRRILALVREHPDGLSPSQTRHVLGVDKSLAHTMVAMARDGLLQRVQKGRYIAPE